MKRSAVIVVVLIVAAAAILAQRRGRTAGGYGGGYGWRRQYFDSYKTPREIPQHSAPTPMWTNEPGFDSDTFTFVRVKRERGYGIGGDWSTDTPDSDLNLSFRLQQVTSMRVDPNGLFMHLTETNLSDYPFIYMVEPGSLYLSDEEAAALRKYLLNGGFLMLDDFWGERQWANMEHELKKVFPERDFVELALDHPLYHCVFEINTKGQVPNVELGTQSEYTHVPWE